MKRILLLVLSLILVGTFAIGCEKSGDMPTGVVDELKDATDSFTDEFGITIDENTITFVDGRGEAVTVDKNPKRAIVLFASFVDIWMRNGGDMVGMVEPSNEYYMPGTEHIETLGKQGSISLEKVISLEPDLVVLSYNTGSHHDLFPALEKNNIPIMVLDYRLKEDYFKISKIFAAINDRMDLYEQDAQMVKEEIEKIMSNVPKDKGVKVLGMMATKNVISALGSDTTLGEMFKDLGAINIADGSNGQLSDKNFSLEKILEEDPDFIFVQAMGSDMDAIEERIRSDAQSNPAWNSLKAVKNDNYIVLDKELYTYKANHRYAEAYRGLAEIMYPEVFK